MRRRIASGARRHLGERVRAVLVAEELLGEPHGYALVAREEAEAGDGLAGRAETEEERRARWDRLEAVRRRLPEVDLVRRLGAVQEVAEPAEVGVGDERAQGHRGVHVSDHDARRGPSLPKTQGLATTSPWFAGQARHEPIEHEGSRCVDVVGVSVLKEWQDVTAKGG